MVEVEMFSAGFGFFRAVPALKALLYPLLGDKFTVCGAADGTLH
jgi:hypothetical protein